MSGVSLDPTTCSIWIGWEPREASAFSVAAHSIKKYLSCGIPIHSIVLDAMRSRGWYWRPITRLSNKLYDPISAAPMATEFAISRFLTPHLHRELYGSVGWALFMDCDMLARADLAELFVQANQHYALMCVKHNYKPVASFKMDGQVQTTYSRKNWSSVMLFNMAHPATGKLTIEMVNTLPGRDLHAFCWLDDSEIGSLDPAWNHLVGHSSGEEPKLVHFTEGGPWLPEYSDAPYGAEWHATLREAMRV